MLTNQESVTECMQSIVDKIRQRQYFSEEIMNNAMQLLKKIQSEEKELKNVDDIEEPSDDEEGSNESMVSTNGSEHLKEDADNLDEIDETVNEMKQRDSEEVKKLSNMSADQMKKELGKAGLIVSIKYMAE